MSYKSKSSLPSSRNYGFQWRAKLPPMSYQTVRRRGCVVQSERLCRDVIFSILETVLLLLYYNTFLSKLKSPNTDININHRAPLGGNGRKFYYLNDKLKLF